MKNYYIDDYFLDQEAKTLYLKGWAYHESPYQISVVVDRQQILLDSPNEYRMDICDKYTSKEDERKFGFEYTINLKSIVHKIEVFAVIEDEKYRLFSVKIPVTPVQKVFHRVGALSGKCMKVLWKQNIRLLNPKTIYRYFCTVMENRQYQKSSGEYVNPNNSFQYRNWAVEKEKIEGKETYQEFSYRPLISILVPVYNVPIVYLKACIDSVLMQTYPNFELCLADDCSTDLEIKKVLKQYEKKDKRIKVVYRTENGHISKASNSCLAIATGEFISLLDNDDVITKDALYQVVKVLNENPKLDLIYSDEDKLDLNEHLCFPTYKPDWSPDLFHCYNYLCHFTTIRKKVMDQVGGFRVGYEGAQDYDLFLRITAKIKDSHIYHIPKILYHWRMIAGSTAAVMTNKNYAFGRGKKALQEYFDKKKISCKVGRVPELPYYYPNYKYTKKNLITVIINGRGSRLNKCIHRLEKYTDYKKMEILTSEMGSFKELIERAKGVCIVVMDENTIITKESSIHDLITLAMQDHIGVVSPSIKKKNSYFRSSGVVLFKNNFKHIIYSTRQRTTAIEPKLHIPVNYTVPGTKVLVFSKEKYLHVNTKLKINDFPNEIDIIRMCLNFRKRNFYNVTLAPNEFLYAGSLELEYEMDEYKKLKIAQDSFYNPNLSESYLYQLDKFSEGEENNE